MRRSSFFGATTTSSSSGDSFEPSRSHGITLSDLATRCRSDIFSIPRFFSKPKNAGRELRNWCMNSESGFAVSGEAFESTLSPS